MRFHATAREYTPDTPEMETVRPKQSPPLGRVRLPRGNPQDSVIMSPSAPEGASGIQRQKTPLKGTSSGAQQQRVGYREEGKSSEPRCGHRKEGQSSQMRCWRREDGTPSQPRGGRRGDDRPSKPRGHSPASRSFSESWWRDWNEWASNGKDTYGEARKK